MSVPKIYFNVYVAGVLKQRPDHEMVNTDLLYFTLLMKANFFAKEVFALRVHKPEDTEGLTIMHNQLKLIRTFMLDFFDIPEPNWNLIQDELNDDLETLKKLPDPDARPKVSAESVSADEKVVSHPRERSNSSLGCDEEKERVPRVDLRDA